jgi:hypothetical protein
MPHQIYQSKELRQMLPYSEDDKKFLISLVRKFRKKQDKEFSKSSDAFASQSLRDFLALYEFKSYVVRGWYVLYSDDPDDPIRDTIPRCWIVVDNKYIVDTHADRFHDRSYRIVITKLGNKEYRLQKPSKSAMKMRAKLRNLLRRKKKKKVQAELE